MTTIECRMYKGCCAYNLSGYCMSKGVVLSTDGYGHLECYTKAIVDEIVEDYKFTGLVNLTPQAVNDLLTNDKVPEKLKQKLREVIR